MKTQSLLDLYDLYWVTKTGIGIWGNTQKSSFFANQQQLIKQYRSFYFIWQISSLTLLGFWAWINSQFCNHHFIIIISASVVHFGLRPAQATTPWSSSLITFLILISFAFLVLMLPATCFIFYLLNELVTIIMKRLFCSFFGHTIFTTIIHRVKSKFPTMRVAIQPYIV